jgi:hypothetical protein
MGVGRTSGRVMLGLFLAVVALTVIAIIAELALIANGFDVVQLHPSYKQRFDETITLATNPFVHPDTVQALNTIVDRGRRTAASAHVVVMGLCRNVRTSLARTRRTINALCAPFRKANIVLFENDSTDGTRAALEAWAAQDIRVTLLDCCTMGSCECTLRAPSAYKHGAMASCRIERMALYRDRCLRYAAMAFPNAEFAIVIDMDLRGQVMADGVLLALGVRDTTPWTAVFACGVMPIPGSWGTMSHVYDPLAFVPHGTPLEPDTQTTAERGSVRLVNDWFDQNIAVGWWSDMVRGTTQKDLLVPVASAFNGCGLFDFQVMKHGRYMPLRSCEHIGLLASINSWAARRGAPSPKYFILRPWVLFAGIQGPLSAPRVQSTPPSADQTALQHA